MAKKNLLGGFKFEKLPEISNGLIIPTGNDTRPKKEIQAPPTPEPVRQALKPQIVRQTPNHNFGKLDVDFKAFMPMTNVVPTIKGIHVPTNKPVIVPEREPKFKGLTRKQRQRIVPEDLNMNEYGALPTNKERIAYLALHGWAIRPQKRGNGLFYYATRYVNRKKKTFYVCPVGNYG